MISLAELIEVETDFLSWANQAREAASYSRNTVREKERHQQRADTYEHAAKRMREFIEKYEPRKPLLRLVKDSANGG